MDDSLRRSAARRHPRVGLAAALSALVLLVPLSCSDGDDPMGLGGSATLDLLLTDASGDVARVFLDIDEVYLQGGPGGRTTVLEGPTGFLDVTALVGTTAELVTDVDISEGSYGQLRFVIGAAVLETEGGDVYVFGSPAELPDGLVETGDLQCPSCAQSGIKVILPRDDGAEEEEVEIEEGENIIVLDFDVAETFGRQAGNSGRWIMRPVIHGARFSGDLEAGFGRIEGSIALGTEPVVEIPECPAGTPRALTDVVPTVVASTLVDGEGAPLVRTGHILEGGAFRIGILTADSYTFATQTSLELEGAVLSFGLSAVPPSVQVSGGAVNTGVALTVTSATCTPTG